MRRGVAAAIVAAAACLLALPAAAGAARIKVTTNADDFGGSSTSCSLREAVQAANADTDFGGCVRNGSGTDDTVRLIGGTTYLRSPTGTPENANASGDLDITGPTTIEVREAGRATIDADLEDRAIAVLAGGSLTASRLVITRGFVLSGQPANDTSGGGISVAFDGSLDLRSSRVAGNFTTNNENCACGGGIGAAGKTKLRRVNVEGNASFGVGGGVALIAGPLLRVDQSRIYDNTTDFGGGGLYLAGFDSRARVKDTTIAENDALGFSDGSGGGIWVAGSGTGATLTNTTITGNQAYVYGGGISIFSGSLSLNAVTISDNAANIDANGTGSAGGIFNSPARTRNSIIAGNFDLSPADPEHDCNQSFAGSHNLYGLDGGCFTGTQNEDTADPRLRPLADNGGFAETLALKGSSPAIGLAGKSAPPKDQRGVRRDADPDSGAYER